MSAERSLTRALAAGLCLSAAAAAPAPAPHAAAERRWKELFEPCRAEARAFCPDVAHWQGPLADCLKGRELSSLCRAAWNKASKHLEQVRITLDFERDCRADSERFCSGMDASNGLIRCVDYRKEQVSPACRAALGKAIYSYRSGYKRKPAEVAAPTPAAAKLWRGLYKPCRAEAEAFCRDVPRWQGLLAECLAPHEPELSPGCRPAWAKADRDYEDGKSAAMFEFICRPDSERLCPGQELGKGLSACLDAKKKGLSKGCREAMENASKSGPR